MSHSSILVYRTIAFCIDLLIVMVLSIAFFAFILAVWSGETSQKSAVSQIAILLIFFIHFLLMFRDFPYGQSPGKRVMGLRVVLLGTNELPRLPRLMLRNLPVVLIPVDFILVQLQFIHRTKVRRLGDQIADTEVILEKDFIHSSIKKSAHSNG